MEIYVVRNGERLGPYRGEQFKEMSDNGLLMVVDLARNEQTNEWQRLYMVAWLVPRLAVPATYSAAFGHSVVSEPSIYPTSRKTETAVAVQGIAVFAGKQNAYYTKAFPDADCTFQRLGEKARN